MGLRIKLLFVSCFIILSFVLSSCAHAEKPQKPGPNFVWVKGHVSKRGVPVPGHWKYTGSGVKGKTWVPGHHRANGKWIPGHWKVLTPPKNKAVWIPGHYGPGGRWIAGHWR
jgi:hypothetical protein